MSNNIEIEAKVLLNEDDYLKIKKKLSFLDIHKIIQTNHYIDSKERFLKSQGIALRIREKDKEYHLTLKTPLSEGLLEKNQKLTEKQFKELVEKNIFPAGSISEFLEILGIDMEQLNVLTSLTTERYEKEYNEGHVALDKNTYSSIVDFELEMEQSSIANAENLINELLSSLQIKYIYNHISKQARAIKAQEHLVSKSITK